MSEYWGNVQETSTIYTGLHVSEYWGIVHETSNFIQGYMCQSTWGVCMRQVTLYWVTCARVLGA